MFRYFLIIIYIIQKRNKERYMQQDEKFTLID